MTFRIRTIDFTAAGREIVRERVIEQDRLSIGRAAENDIHLADLAIELHHVDLVAQSSGKLEIAATGGLGFSIDGRTEKSASVKPGEGAELELGGFRLAISQDRGDAIRITVTKSTEGKEAVEAKRAFALGSTLPAKRLVSWALAAVVLIAFLAVPVISHMTRERIVSDDIDRPDKVAFDESWSTGALSLAHHSLEDNCEACHVDAFVSVRDSTCLTCHEDMGEHAAQPRLADGRAPFSFGDGLQWAVADMFGKEGPGACTTCHTEHEGPTRMEPASQQFCADCHETLDTRLTDTALGNASDFGKAHPQFQAVLYTELRQTEPARISLGDKPRERSGLKFPHDIHLDPQGGAARMAISLGSRSGYGEPLDCQDCHQATSDRSSFEAVDMEADCESCHSLVYDRVGSTFRTLRHGDVDQMMADLRAMDRSPRRPIVTGRKRPERFARGGPYHSNFGPPRRSLVGVDRALAPGGVCGECHLPAISDGRPGVMPVNLPERYFVHGGFDHYAHRQEECSTCHKAENSKTSSDLLMPDIAICRDCHLGENARQAKVPSSCAMCHSYHMPNKPLPQDHPDTPRGNIATLNRAGG